MGIPTIKELWARPKKKNFFSDITYPWLDKLTIQEYKEYVSAVREFVVTYRNEVDDYHLMTQMASFNTVVQRDYDEYVLDMDRKAISKELFNKTIYGKEKK